MRCDAVLLEADAYRDLEVQLLEQLKTGERKTLRYLLMDSLGTVELLSGEARMLFEAASDFYQHVDLKERQMRLAVAPEELSEFMALVSGPTNEQRFAPVSFNLPRLRELVAGSSGGAGIVILEEDDDWMWVEHPNEIIAVRDDAWMLLQPYLHQLLSVGDHELLARVAADHSESAVEFTTARWNKFQEQLQEAAPELLSIVQHSLSQPGDYVSIRELLALVAEPSVQPSLDAWLRVTDPRESCGLYFRDSSRESMD